MIDKLHYPSLMENLQVGGARQFTSQKLFQLGHADAHLPGHSRQEIIIDLTCSVRNQGTNYLPPVQLKYVALMPPRAASEAQHVDQQLVHFSHRRRHQSDVSSIANTLRKVASCSRRVSPK